MSHRLVVPPNIALLLLPPNVRNSPYRNIGSSCADNWLSNRVFQILHDMSIHWRAWNKLYRSALAHHVIGMRDWAHGS